MASVCKSSDGPLPQATSCPRPRVNEAARLGKVAATIERLVKEQELMVDGGDSGAVRPELTSSEVETWDSVLHITLLLTLEQTFGVSFEPEEGAGLTSVPAIKTALARRNSGRVGH